MGRRRNPPLLARLKTTLTSWYLRQFHDAAEIRLLEILGGSTLTIGRLRHDGRTFTLILSRGKLLKSEHFKRVALDNRTTLFMNDINQAIMIQGDDYQYDVLKYQEQEEALAERGIRVRYIPQRWLERNPLKALQAVQRFVYY